MTRADSAGAIASSSSASAYPRIEVNGVRSSWLTDSRKRPCASRARASSSDISLNDAPRSDNSSSPRTGTDTPASPVARRRVAADSSPIGRVRRRASRNESTTASRTPPSPARSRLPMNGRHSENAMFAGRIKTISPVSVVRAA